MADGAFAHTIATMLTATVEAGMKALVPFNTLRHKVAAVGKEHGVFIYGTDRIDGVIIVTYDGGGRIEVDETELYRRKVSISTW
jgi:hypothetical protein